MNQARGFLSDSVSDMDTTITGTDTASTSHEDCRTAEGEIRSELSWLLDSIEETINSFDDNSIHSITWGLLSVIQSKQNELLRPPNSRECTTELLVNFCDQLGRTKTWEELKAQTSLPEVRRRTTQHEEETKRRLVTTCLKVLSKFAGGSEGQTRNLQEENARGICTREGGRQAIYRIITSEGVERAPQPSLVTNTSSTNTETTTLALIDAENIPNGELDWANLKHLGGGSYGTVWRSQWGGVPVAIKVLREGKNLKEFELECMRRLYHPNVVALYGTSMEPEKALPAFVMELCDMSLSDYLHAPGAESRKVTLDFVMDVGADISCGLMFIYCNNIIHRDLKPANVLLKKASDRLHAKICDFGVSLDKVLLTRIDDEACGTTRYMAPEQFQEDPLVSPKTDIYSLGIVLWEMFERKRPWLDKKAREVKSLVTNGKRPEFTGHPIPATNPLKALIKRCWDVETKNRPFAREVYEVLRNSSTRGFCAITKNPDTLRHVFTWNEATSTGHRKARQINETSSAGTAEGKAKEREVDASTTKAMAPASNSEKLKHNIFSLSSPPPGGPNVRPWQREQGKGPNPETKECCSFPLSAERLYLLISFLLFIGLVVGLIVAIGFRLPTTSSPTSLLSFVPSTAPTPLPPSAPVSAPASLPTSLRSSLPTIAPTTQHSGAPPASLPTSLPPSFPTIAPTTQSPAAPLTSLPTSLPSSFPTSAPTTQSPTAPPTSLPTLLPSSFPTVAPTTQSPVTPPTPAPTSLPTFLPTNTPTTLPPTTAPTTSPPTFPPATACDSDNDCVGEDTVCPGGYDQCRGLSEFCPYQLLAAQYRVQNQLKGSYLSQDPTLLAGGPGPGETWDLQPIGSCEYLLQSTYNNRYLSQQPSSYVNNFGEGEKWYIYPSRSGGYIIKNKLKKNYLSQAITTQIFNVGPGELWHFLKLS